MDLRRFSCFSIGERVNERASAMPNLCQLTLWSLAMRLYQFAQPSMGYGQARSWLVQRFRSGAWAMKGIHYNSAETRSRGGSKDWGPKLKDLEEGDLGIRTSLA